MHLNDANFMHNTKQIQFCKPIKTKIDIEILTTKN